MVSLRQTHDLKPVWWKHCPNRSLYQSSPYPSVTTEPLPKLLVSNTFRLICLISRLLIFIYVCGRGFPPRMVSVESLRHLPSEPALRIGRLLPAVAASTDAVPLRGTSLLPRRLRPAKLPFFSCACLFQQVSSFPFWHQWSVASIPPPHTYQNSSFLLNLFSK